MDSRDYICAFTIYDAGDIPLDFAPPPGVRDCRAGLFLPQSEPDWLGRHAHPARIVLLSRDTLFVIPHPRSKDRALVIPLRDLVVLECGRILLRGWIGLYGGNAHGVLPYNRRDAITVERFLARLRALWLAEQDDVAGIAAALPPNGSYGAALNEKFKHALETEAIDGEPPLIRLFLPPVRHVRRRIFRYETWSGGDLIVVSRGRVLWITERRGTVFEPYGTVSHSAPIEMLAGIAYAHAGRGPLLRVRLQSGLCWQLPVSDGHKGDAQSFADAITRALNISREKIVLPVRAGSTGSGSR